MLGRIAPLVAIGLAALLACAGSAGSSPQAIPVPDLFVMNADGSSPVNITNSPSWDSDPAWSPDGTRIAYASDAHIVVANADGSNRRVLTQDGYNRYPAWSPNGKKIAFSGGYANSGGYTGSFDIHVMNASGSGKVNLTRSSAADDSEPSWSADGKKIAYVTGRDRSTGDDSEVCVMTANGTSRRRLTHNNQPDHNPAWSPNGAKIAFGRTRWASAEERTSDVWLMHPDGSRKAFLTGGRSSYQPAWSPDGTQIAYTRGLKISIVKADGSGRVDLGDNSSDWDTNPSWSPNGRKIVFQRGDSAPFLAPSQEGRPPQSPCGPPSPPPARCHVPRVVGLSLSMARFDIRYAHCAVGHIRRARSKRVGRVISQYPYYGAVRPRGGKVNLVVGRRR